jgi:hypothetical protein
MIQTELLFSFRTIYFNPPRHGNGIQLHGARVLDDLRHSGSRVHKLDRGLKALNPQTSTSAAAAARVRRASPRRTSEGRMVETAA